MTPQPEPLPHIDRFTRLLHMANQIVLHVQEQAEQFSCGRNGMCLPFFKRNFPVKEIQDDFRELFALMQVLRLNLESLEEELSKEGAQ